MQLINLKKIFDNTANENSKTLTVGPNEVWKPSHLHVIYTSTATAGNRQLLFQVLDDSANVVIDIHAGAVQAASLTRHYSFQKGIYRETVFVDGSIQVPMPFDLWMLPSWQLLVKDETAVDAADDFVLSGVIEVFSR